MFQTALKPGLKIYNHNIITSESNSRWMLKPHSLFLNVAEEFKIQT